MAEKVRVAGVTERVCGAATVSVTGMAIGLPVAPAAVMVTVPVYGLPLAVRVPALTLTVTEPGVAPLAGVTVSQLPPLVVVTAVVKLMAPGVPFTVMACAAGAVPPCTCEKASEAGAGGDGSGVHSEGDRHRDGSGPGRSDGDLALISRRAGGQVGITHAHREGGRGRGPVVPEVGVTVSQEDDGGVVVVADAVKKSD